MSLGELVPDAEEGYARVERNEVLNSMLRHLSPRDRDIVVQAAKEAGQAGNDAARKGLGANGDRSSLDELARRGVEVIDLSPAEKQAFARATRPVYDKWAQTVGTDLVRQAEAAIAKAS